MMLRVLLKKQLSEVFRSYFYDAKKNRMRSKGAIIAFFVLFVAVMVGMLGGMFTALALTLCDALISVGMGWLYFVLMCGIAVLLGAFGSVFNTYAGLYLAKDNDLLLSLPIPVRTILTARLLNVYLMGAMYSAVVLLPTLIVYWAVAGATFPRIVCGILLMLTVTVFVLLLSCLLGWVAAKISLKLKNKSFITVLISLVFIGAYYFFYFKAQSAISDLIQNAEAYGTAIKGAAYGLYLFGRMGEGDWLCTALFVGVTAALFALIWTVLMRSFIGIATSTGSADKTRYVEKRAKQRSAFGAMVLKELRRFASSANYMLNCGLGIVLLPASAVLFLVKGRVIFGAIDDVLAARPGASAVLACLLLCFVSTMNEPATPSVSLEGKSLWIAQSLPVRPETVLLAKAAMQALLATPPVLFASIAAAITTEGTIAVRLLAALFPSVFTLFYAVYCTVIGVKMPILNWTNEVVPIKQSGAVLITLFSGWAMAAIPAVLYLLFGHLFGAFWFLLILCAVFAAAGLLLLRWLTRTGGRVLAAL